MNPLNSTESRRLRTPWSIAWRCVLGVRTVSVRLDKTALQWAIVLVSMIPLTGCQWIREFCNRPTAQAQRLAEQARAAELAGNHEQAARLLQQALELDEDGDDLHRDMARIMQAQGNQTAAIEHLQHATYQNPDDVEGLVELAEVLLQRNRKLEAVAALDTALGSDPNHVTALLMRSELAHEVNDDESALAALHHLLTIEPKHVAGRMMVAKMLLETQRPEQAAPLLRGVYNSHRATPDQVAAAAWSLGIAYGQESRWRETVATLAKAAELQGNQLSADQWYRLAYARSQLGDWEGSQADLRRALRENPAHRQARSMSTYLQQQLQQPRENAIIRIGHSVGVFVPPKGW